MSDAAPTPKPLTARQVTALRADRSNMIRRRAATESKVSELQLELKMIKLALEHLDEKLDPYVSSAQRDFHKRTRK